MTKVDDNIIHLPSEGPLFLADNLKLPIEAVTETFLDLGQRGAGKTNTAAVIAEEMHAHGAPFAVLTPVDVWWGLKSTASGKGTGLPVYIFGGAHADLPLSPTQGKVMADVLIEHRVSCVICTDGFSGKERASFVTELAERLLAKNRQPLHLIVEEADAFIPQRPYPGEERMLGAMDRLIRWGRSPSGIGGTFICQRSAKINKDVTTQCSVLVAHRTTGPQDVDAIKEWFRYHPDTAKQQQLLKELGTLPKGVAYIYSPAWLDMFRRVQIRRRYTFDSAATPKLGVTVKEPQLAAVDLKLLEKQMAESSQKLKADDPKELRKEIARLTAELKTANTFQSMAVKPAVTPVKEIFTAADRKELQKLAVLVDRKMYMLASHDQELQKFELLVQRLAKLMDTAGRTIPARVEVKRQPAVQVTGQAGSSIPNAERKILTVLAQYPEGKERLSLAHLAGYTVSGHFKNLLGALRSKGYATEGNPIRITDAGVAALGSYEPLPTGESLRHHWLDRLPVPEAKILATLFAAWPRGMDREELAAAAGYEVSGHFKNLLGSLRTKGLVERGNPIKASSSLYEE